jgi:four helix bundle protein
LNITNNIAEGLGSISGAGFANFLNIFRRPVFEMANMLILLSQYGPFSETEAQPLLQELEEHAE